MLSLVAALLAASPAPTPHAVALGRTAWVFSTVQQSEWCPAGNVRLELGTGRFAVTAGASRRVCNDAGLERPVSMGRLGAGRLAAVRAAYLRALRNGLVDPACRNGGRRHDIVLDNGGPRVLVLTTGAQTQSAPDDRTCWSDAARALHSALDDAFRSAQRP